MSTRDLLTDLHQTHAMSATLLECEPESYDARRRARVRKLIERLRWINRELDKLGVTDEERIAFEREWKSR